MNNISDINDNCYGCMACLNICPNNAIEMKENKEGFLYPFINSNCTNCGICKSACPHLVSKFDNEDEPTCYAYMANDDIRSGSSSGGAFPILANYFIDNGGYVAGAIWNQDATVMHIVSNDIEDINKMRNSKYLQSTINDCYREIKTLLLNSKLVLFTGTPCQVAGLKSFLKKDYDNLYCVDIICHGVPSPKIFKKYIKEKIKNNDEIWLNTNFRDKINGWNSNLTTTTTTTKTSITDSVQTDTFMNAFLKNLCLRKTCTNCKFQTIPRQGDITIGDFWGIGNYNKKIDDNKGTSVVLINNKKGEFLLDILKNSAKRIVDVPLKYAIAGNPCLVKSVSPHKDRKLFFKLSEKFNMEKLNDICLKDKVDYLIVNFWDSYYNYGALCTAFAIQNLVESFGFTSKLLDVGQRTNTNWYKGSFVENFVQRFLNITNQLNYKQAQELSKKVKGVILGSDQILRLDYISYNLNKYFLNWVNTNTRKIALSASFGINKEEFLSSANYTMKIEKQMTNALQSFDYLSCREISGKQIFKDIFNLDSDQILDPVFLIDKNEYEKIIKCSQINNSNKIISYILDNKDEYKNLYKYLSEKENSEIININNREYLVEDWIKSIKESKFVITDSFHGVCFSLIYNKPFICIRNKKRGDARFESLIKTFDIADNFIYSVDEIYNKPQTNINYDKINKILEDKKNFDLKIIEQVLCNNYSNNPNAKCGKIKNEKYIKSMNRYSLSDFKLNLNYNRCRLLANLTFGKKKEHYITKKHSIKQRIQERGAKW